MKHNQLTKIIFTGLCISLGIVLSYFMHSFGSPGLGSILLPMHIPVLICGFVCGPWYGVSSGFITPVLSFLLMGLPPIFPVGVSMMFELATYGFLSAFMYRMMKGKILLPLIISMIGGRLVMAGINLILFQFLHEPYGIAIFISSALITAMPGIIIQLTLIPIIVHSLKKANIIQVTNLSS